MSPLLLFMMMMIIATVIARFLTSRKPLRQGKKKSTNMKEKVVPIPFLGKDVSAWLYRTTRWTREHPWKTSGILLACVGGSILYEAQVTHKNRILSPNVNNHLEYQLKQSEALRAAAGLKEALPDEVAQDAQKLREHSQRTVLEAEALLAKAKSPEEREALQKLIDAEKQLMSGIHDTTMLVRSGQLLVRAPHWEIRNNERNWSILARDRQQQKDHYWYRAERSKEDDYARNTYSRP
ncbi:hypothetical protein STCU_03730 [Strigomonas culicis]|uniref:Uncharacterized protein n=1 Tax=Strigomonas culicis TaxID=28005 RepID=S9UQ24_9TRYP|nr:hypothetical protein STCU_03730 [Strigomonas culicis]|eukprot:EPY30973.1 hypothetical protein STCU_03730 [Strigomonas culicis]